MIYALQLCCNHFQTSEIMAAQHACCLHREIIIGHLDAFDMFVDFSFPLDWPDCSFLSDGNL